MKRITIPLTFKGWDGKEHHFTPKSIFCLSNKNKVRKFLVGLITWKWFEIFITVMILANSAMLGMMDYTDPDRDHWGNNLVANTELFFIITFTIEATVKVLGMGFILGKGSYLRNAWNWLDFVVVIASLLTFPATIQQYIRFENIQVVQTIEKLDNSSFNENFSWNFVAINELVARHHVLSHLLFPYIRYPRSQSVVRKDPLQMLGCRSND